jgi:hypothetical protein
MVVPNVMSIALCSLSRCALLRQLCTNVAANTVNNLISSIDAQRGVIWNLLSIQAHSFVLHTNTLLVPAGALPATDTNFAVVANTIHTVLPLVCVPADNPDVDGCKTASGNPCSDIPNSDGTCIDGTAPGPGFSCGCVNGFAWYDGACRGESAPRV